MKNKVCKKCQRPLPKGYKHEYCESCRNKHVQGVKTCLKATAGLASIALVVVTRGKYTPKK